MSKFNSDSRRKILVALLRIEGVFILGLGLYLIVKGLITGGSIEWFVISGILFMTLFGGIGLLLSANGFKNQKMYGRAPAVLANLIALGVVKYQAEAGLYYIAIPLAILAVVTLYFILTIASRENKAK